jgi:hypothetical protein
MISPLFRQEGLLSSHDVGVDTIVAVYVVDDSRLVSTVPGRNLVVLKAILEADVYHFNPFCKYSKNSTFVIHLFISVFKTTHDNRITVRINKMLQHFIFHQLVIKLFFGFVEGWSINIK